MQDSNKAIPYPTAALESMENLEEFGETNVSAMVCSDENNDTIEYTISPLSCIPDETPVKPCKKCDEYSDRLEKLQDLHHKIKQRQAILETEVRHLRKLNKQLQWVCMLRLYNCTMLI